MHDLNRLPGTEQESEEAPKSRRWLLASGIGAGVAGVAALGGADPSGASTGNDLVLGSSNTATSRTFLDASSPMSLIGFQCNVIGPGSIGSYGSTAGGIGVQGSDYGGPSSEMGTGVYATSDLGDGIKAQGGRHGAWGIGGATGAGVLAENPSGGPALQVNGRASFSRSGLVTVPAHTRSVTVTGVALSTQSMVLATLQAHVGNLSIAAAVPNPSASSFALFLTATPRAPTTVAWLVID